MNSAVRSRHWRSWAVGFLSLSLLMLGLPALPSASAAPITLAEVATGFNNPIGIDHHEPTNQLVISVNYPTGTPSNFALVAPDGTQSPFSAISGLTDELKLATVRSGPCQGGFAPGEMFTGSGAPGVVVRVAPDGSSIQNPWVQLPGESGLLRGSLFQDRYCAFGGDLIVVTTAGGVWRINSAGVPTKLAQIPTHLEGVTTLPNDPSRYGPWAGKIVVGAEQQTRFYTIDTAGTVVPYDLGISPEDLDLINPNENFYGVDFASKKILTADKTQWTSMVGDLAVAQESPGILWRVHWDPAAGQFTKEQLATVGQWEHVTFSPASIVTVGINLDPPTATNVVGHPHTATATVADSEGGLQSGIPVDFTVEGANAGATGTCSPAGCATGPDGKVSFTYTGTAPGDDNITACFTNRRGERICSTATKTWTNPPVEEVSISINDVTVVEGDPPALTPATFTVTLSSPAGPNGVTVNVTTASAPPANPHATADVDYNSQTNTLITFAPGEQSKPFTVQVKGDLTDEPDEQYLVNLSQPVNATIGDGQGVGTILDDELKQGKGCPKLPGHQDKGKDGREHG
jgi:hypothetical protein